MIYFFYCGSLWKKRLVWKRASREAFQNRNPLVSGRVPRQGFAATQCISLESHIHRESWDLAEIGSQVLQSWLSDVWQLLLLFCFVSNGILNISAQGLTLDIQISRTGPQKFLVQFEQTPWKMLSKNLTNIHALKYSFMLLIVKYDCYNLSFPSPGWVA